MTESEPMDCARWHNYVMKSGAPLKKFWETYLKKKRHILFVLGKGFDPRMCCGFRLLLGAGGDGKRDVIAIRLDEGASSPSKAYEPDVQSNWDILNKIVKKKNKKIVKKKNKLLTRVVKLRSEDGRPIGAHSAARLFNSLTDFTGYTDIVLDISALPRGVYFPLIAKILYMLDKREDSEGKKPNLHVLVAENLQLDSSIQDERVNDTATYIFPFIGALDIEATEDYPKVWIPVLGERRVEQLQRIYKLVKPHDIAPVLPSPSVNLRRSDDLLLEYRELLFDRMGVNPKNFILASERNPFEAYRQIRKAILQYKNTVQSPGDLRTVLSVLSSKLMSVGALLVAHELRKAKMRIGIAHVGCQGYTIDKVAQSDGENTQSELFGLWLWGECYET